MKQLCLQNAKTYENNSRRICSRQALRRTSGLNKSNYFRMKGLWLFIFFMNSVFINTHAQGVRFGVFANPLISWIKTDVSRIGNDGCRLGINVGLMIDRFFTEHYAFSSGISIRSMGGALMYTEGKSIFRSSNGEISGLPIHTSVKYKLQYIHIPLAIKLRTTEIGYTTYYAHVGLDPMINIKANADIKSLQATNIGVNREINSIYIGYHIGAGLEYRIIGNTSFTTGITYINGFTDVTENNSASSEKAVMHSFELQLGIIF